MKKNVLWNISTTIRNPNRIISFLETAKEIEGAVWDSDIQVMFQVSLIKNRHYEPTFMNLSDRQQAILKDHSYDMTYDEAANIFNAKKYEDPPMRGRTSFNPLVKLGLIRLVYNDKNIPHIKITDYGQLFLNKKIDLSEVIFTSFLKFQYPNPLSEENKDFNIRPFMGMMHLIKEVNNLCMQNNEQPVGISIEELGIFALSITRYDKIQNIANELYQYRQDIRRLKGNEAKQSFKSKFINNYLYAFNNPEKNIREYSDNIIRYLRLTKYFYIRGNGYYIDLEPRRTIEIKALLNSDNASAKLFDKNDYVDYLCKYDSYTLPFDDIEKLVDIAKSIISENKRISNQLGIEYEAPCLPKSKKDIYVSIKELRETRVLLTNKLLKKEYENIQKIDEVIYDLNQVFTSKNKKNRPSVELEKLVFLSLSILNDAILIHPNYHIGDDNEPTFTAPAGVADIECFYHGFNAICEVTLLTSRSQWYNEGQPVMRHLRDFEEKSKYNDNFCLFLAPKLHQDTVNTFWNAVKYEYIGQKQKIIPISISSFVEILTVVKELKVSNIPFTKKAILSLFQVCSDVTHIQNSKAWIDHIAHSIKSWQMGLKR
ncbi:MAG: AlwI family type II restriction endonuclease [Candidatus Cloacimonetes bacterium]|nr:AlwI family type II restriction endonuclease [Candidatus Cloacimonadota bacterium]